MTAFRQTLLNSDFAISVELPLHPAQSLRELQRDIELLGPVVDAVQINDNEKAEGHIAPLAMASLLRESGVEPVIHLTCRDRNRIALQSEILGAAAIGVSTLLLWRGNKLPSSFRGRVRSVFDTKATQLLATAVRLRDMSKLETASDLFLGTYVTIFEPDQRWRAEGVFEKIDAGAAFLQTRPCLDADLVRSWVGKLVELRITHRAMLIVGVPLITSIAEARNLTERHPDAQVPETVARRLTDAHDGRKEGIEILAEFLDVLMSVPGVAGANIVYEGDAEAVVEAIALARSKDLR